MFLKGNRQIRNSSSINRNGNINDYNDGNLGLCCVFSFLHLKAINKYIRKQRPQLDMCRQCHCAGPLCLISYKQQPLQEVHLLAIWWSLQRRIQSDACCHGDKSCSVQNWSPNIKPFPLDMILFGLSGGQAGNNLQNLRNLNESEQNL